MITLQNLIAVAPFTDDVRTQLIQSLDQLSLEKQQELSGLCWDAILKQYQANVRFTLQQQSLQAAGSQDAALLQSIQEIEETLALDLQKKFVAVGSSIELKDLRKELQTLQNKTQ